MTTLHIQSLIWVLMFAAYVAANLMIPTTRKFIIRHIIGLMGCTYLAGFLLYLWGFWYGASANFLTASLRAAIAALEMFASRSELIEVSEELKEENMLYMVMFALVHFQALMLSLVFIVDMFGKRLESRMAAWRLLFNAGRRRLLIFDGADEKTLAIARSIPADPDSEIVFVQGMLDTEVKSVSLLEALIKGVKNRNNLDDFEAYGTVLNTPVSLAMAFSMRKGWVYRSCLKLIKRYSSAEVFLMSWDSPMNADASYWLSEDLPEGLDVKIYAGVNTYKPHSEKLTGKRYVTASNRSYFVAEDLCRNTPLLTCGAGKHTLVIGFGHTAQTCIESMVDAGFDRIDVADPEVARRMEEYLCFHPGYRDIKGLKFHSHAVRSNEFWAFLSENMKSLDNVVIFGQDGSANFETAFQILRYARKVKTDLTGFRIFLMEDKKQPGDDAEHIFTFGKTEDIFSYQHITNTESIR